jgi:hypothetical protein
VRLLLLPLLLAACGTSAAAQRREEEAGRPDAAALARETIVRAKTARLVLSDYWRGEAELTAASPGDAEAATRIARGNVKFKLRGLSVEASESLELRWLPDHDNLLLDAKEVALFHQKRARPYHLENATAVVMANDQISFFQQ